jgi:hypothetical protein
MPHVEYRSKSIAASFELSSFLLRDESTPRFTRSQDTLVAGHPVCPSAALRYTCSRVAANICLCARLNDVATFTPRALATSPRMARVHPVIWRFLQVSRLYPAVCLE